MTIHLIDDPRIVSGTFNNVAAARLAGHILCLMMTDPRKNKLNIHGQWKAPQSSHDKNLELTKRRSFSLMHDVLPQISV